MTAGSVARIAPGHGAESSITTGIAVLDHLLAGLALAGGFELSLEIAPDVPEAEVGAAGAALGQALRPLLEAKSARGHGVGIVPSDEALAMVALESSGRPLVASNADLTSTRAGGLRSDIAATFLESLASAAALTIHVRLIEGEDSQHVLAAIFKALGAALGEAARSGS